jgi:4-amino-4-deoxy-L-arabinose transferase-like glycosyltransferase
MDSSIPEWRRQVADTSMQRAGILEPPILEILTAYIYRIIKGEHLWVARLLSSIFWLVGAIFLYMITKRIVSVDAALVTITYYLLVPIGVIASLSFLPEPMMIMMLLLSLLTILRYFEKSSKFRLAIAGFISGLAILVKPFCIFTILSCFILLSFYKKATWKHIINLDFFIFIGICFSVGAFYYWYGIFIGKFLKANFQSSFLPYLFLKREYWKGWFLYAIGAVKYTPFFIALFGIPMLQKGLSRGLLIGLCVGYVIFCLIYTYPIPLSSHYHLQLIIIVAIALGPIASLVINCLIQSENKWYWWIPTISAFLLILLLNTREIKSNIASYKKYESREIAQKIGEIVGHSTRTVYIAPYYGMPLEYYGELSGTYWPRRVVNWDWIKDRMHGTVQKFGSSWFYRINNWIFRRPVERKLSIEERLKALNFSPEYFIITDFKRFKMHHGDLKEFLVNNCTLIAEDSKYLIYEAFTK